MKKNFKYMLYTIIVATLIFAAGFFVLELVLGEMCGNDIISEIVSPDGNYKVVVFQRDCGATTGFSTQISLLSVNSDLPNDGGNVFIADGHPNHSGIKLQWIDANKLSITLNIELQTYKKENFIKGIEIIYK